MPEPATPSLTADCYRPFWDHLADHGDNLALLEPRSGRALSYRALAQVVDAVAVRLGRRSRRLVLMRADNSIDSTVALLAVLRAGHVLFLIDRGTPAIAVARLAQDYEVDMAIWDPVGGCMSLEWSASPAYGRMVCADLRAGSGAFPNDLTLILSTSGSTGSPKAVRLSKANLAVNAWQIAQALHIRPGTRTALALPLAYTYGLSVLTSHLLNGGVLVLLDRPVLDPEFWKACAAAAVETLPAVTFTLEVMSDPRWMALRPPRLKTVTHSGSRLTSRIGQWLDEESRRSELSVFKMYGMTEATARMSVLPAKAFSAHAESVGLPVPGGAFEIDANGQVIYRGPNVMMGYAGTRTDLANEDQLRGRLETGDLGRLDEAGRLIITGRLQRFAKVLGLRQNLADMEDYLSRTVETAIVSDDQSIVVYHTLGAASLQESIKTKFCAEFRLPPQLVVWRRLDRLPRAESGKILYAQLPDLGAPSRHH
jgi:acyl-CoA synthetase (AMP-forming)/AMP-acid ligase II